MHFKLPKAILLDLDGTLVVFSSTRAGYWNTVTRDYAREIYPVKPESLSSEILTVGDLFWGGMGRNKKWRLNLREARRKIVRMACDNLHIADEELSDRIADSFSDLREKGENMAFPVPGSADTLNYLRDAGVKLALLTNGTSISQRNKIQKFGLGEWIENILIEEEVGFGKPDERFYLEALSRLGVEPHEAWMIGDNPLWDVIIPQKLGIRAVWINVDDKPVPEGLNPLMVIGKFAEIRDYISD